MALCSKLTSTLKERPGGLDKERLWCVRVLAGKATVPFPMTPRMVSLKPFPPQTEERRNRKK